MKKLFSTVLMLMVATVMFAAPIGQDEALRKASAFIAQHHQSHGTKAMKPARRQPGMNVAAVGGDSFFYVFNVGQDEGFVIVSGDDRAVPILGYADHGSFDAATVPAPVQAWLEGYARQLRQLQASDVQDKSLAPISRSAIAPMLTTHWNQNEPYNNDCPSLYTGAKTVTGCVPTAMAQLMYYHRWPAATKAEIPGYEGASVWGEYGKLTVEGFPAATTFEWDKMKDVYSAKLPEDETERAAALEEQNAVAKLFRVCGTAVQADYRDNSSGGTGAEDNMACMAFLKYFDYSPLLRKVSRDDYMYADWQQLIYSELQAQRPVIYGGQSSGGGHFFLVDGFENGLFHVNWGWGGFCDGYYALSVANPGSNEGTGASATLDGYGLQQVAIIGIKKNEGEQPTDIHMSSAIIGTSGAVIGASFFNKNAETYSFDFGIGYAKSDGTYVLVGNSYTTDSPLDKDWGYNSVTFEVKGLADGVYQLVPVSRVVGTEKWLPNGNVKRDFVVATVSGGQITLAWNQPKVDLKVSGFDCPGKHKIGHRQEVNVTVQNLGDEYYGPIYFFVGSGSTVRLEAYTGITLETNESSVTTFSFNPEIVGSNNLIVSLNKECTKIIGQTTLNINPQGETGENLSVKAFTFDNDNADDWSVPAFTGKITVSNAGTEDFDGEMFLRIYYNVGARLGEYSFYKNVYFEAIVPAGVTADVPFKVEGLTPGTYYWPMVAVNSTILWGSAGAGIRRYEPDMDGIGEVNEEQSNAAIFNLAGQRLSTPQKGIMIVNGKKVVVR